MSDPCDCDVCRRVLPILRAEPPSPYTPLDWEEGDGGVGYICGGCEGNHPPGEACKE